MNELNIKNSNYDESEYSKIKVPEKLPEIPNRPKIPEAIGDIKTYFGKLFDKITIDGEKINIPKIDSFKKDTENHNEVKNENCKSDNNEDIKENTEPRKMQTRNQELEGKSHPETGVPFEKRTVEDSKGETVEVVVPKFESEFDAQLPDELCKETDSKQFKEANKQLKESVEEDSELKSKFNDEQLEQIMDGETPDGYTWHHDADKGKMQLVDSETHAKTGHTGGKSIWGGGSENR